MRQKRESSLKPLAQVHHTIFNVKLNTTLRKLSTIGFRSVLRAPSPLVTCSFSPLSHSAYLSEKPGWHIHS